MHIKGYLLITIGLQLFSAGLLQAEMRSIHNDFEYICSGIFKPETFYGQYTSGLNKANNFDKMYVSKHLLDLSVDVLYGAKTYGEKVAELLFQVRNKGVWGNPESIASTTFADIKILDAIRGTHKHGFPRHVFWIRQLWLQFNLNQAASLPFKNIHTFTIGAFPFQLGRGIALGDAYAVGPEVLGFWSDSSIDQYAFGAKFSGEIFPKILSYDLYTAILQNNSTGLADTEKKVFAQEFGDVNGITNPERGFGKVNYIVAGRLNWNVFDNAWLGRMSVEPYGLYNNDAEQKIEFPSDAASKLGTAGLAGEYYGKRFECGFDYATNFGQQRVRGWDRNIVKENNKGGIVVLVNDNVTANYTNLKGEAISEQAPYVPGSDAQKIVNTAVRSENQNDQIIGTVTNLGYLTDIAASPIVLQNSKARFSRPYTNKYEGWMFVADAAYSFCEKDLLLAVAAGVTSGDDNPNFNTHDGSYDGFIGLQEVYSGKRVRSVFLLGGAGRLKRLLSTPAKTDLQAPSTKAQAISGFTNLVFCGTSLKWKPKSWKKPFEINPNVLGLWQEHKIGIARTFLGVETGLFINYSLLKDLKLFWVSSMFFPGSHYTDRKGEALLTEEERTFYNSENPTGITRDRIAGLGNNVAYTFNMGLIYAF